MPDTVTKEQMIEAILKATRRIIEQNGGDINSLFKGFFMYNNGDALLQYTTNSEGAITAHYDYCGRSFETTFKETDL